jgi:hypothetical protein
MGHKRFIQRLKGEATYAACFGLVLGITWALTWVFGW